MTSVGILACNNGFGHIKRACILNQKLLEIGIHVHLYGDKEKINHYCCIKNINKFKNIINITNLPTAKDYLNFSEKTLKLVFKDFLNKIDSSTFLISDNYYEPFLEGFSGALLANFLWTDLISDISTKNTIKKLQDNSNVTVLASPFARGYLKNFQNNYKVGIFGKQKDQLPDKGYIFICKGFGSWNSGFQDSVENFFCKNEELSDYKIYYDKNIETLNLPLSYSCEKYYGKFCDDFIGHASCIIGRPSLGILTDSISLKVPFIPVFSSNDKESSYNAKIIKGLYKQNNNYCHTQISKLRESINKELDIQMNGEKDAINFILKKINS